MTNLRPNIRVIQQFTTPAPNVPATNLPVLLIGVNRALRNQVDVSAVTGWTGNTAITDQAFPLWAGGKVEPVSDIFLGPKLYVSTLYGIGLVSGVTFSNLATSPAFSTAAGASAVFEIASGTSGRFAINTSAPLVSTFSDDNGNFIADLVADGDVIKVGGVPTYKVAAQGLLADDQLKVKRLDKGPSAISAADAAKILVTAEDSNDYRILYSTSNGYNTAGGFVGKNIKPNDPVILDYWKIRSQGEGLVFDQIGESEGVTVGAHTATADERIAELPAGLAGSFSGPLWNNATGAGSVFFLRDANENFRPVFYATSAKQSGDSYAVKDYATTDLLAIEDADVGEGVVFSAYSYVKRTGDGTSGTTGVFGAADENTGIRTWSDSGEEDLSTNVAIGDHIAVKDTDGIYRPMFEIVGFGADSGAVSPDTTLLVRAFGSLLGDNLEASGVDFMILNPGTPVSFLGSTVSAQNTGTVIDSGGGTATVGAGERLLTADGADFEADGVLPGDLVFSDTGVLLFIVVHVGEGVDDDDKLIVADHPNKGIVLLANEELLNFGYSVRQSLRVDMAVRRVISADAIEIAQLTTSPNDLPDLKTVKGAIYFQTPIDMDEDAYGDDILLISTQDSVSSMNYTIEKTLAGSALTGDLRLSYAEILNNSTTEFIKVTASNYATLVGAAVPANPLGLGARIATANTNTEVYCLQVADDTTDAWGDAFDAAKSGLVYSIVPLTQTDTVLAAAQVHVVTESLPDNKRERILFQSKWHKAQYDRTEYQDGDAPLVSRTSLGVQTVVVQRNLASFGVIVGDQFDGTAFNGTESIEFAGRITAVNVLGDETTLTLVPDGGIPLSTVNLVVTTYTIKSKALNTTEFRDSVAAYATAIAERRVRNIFPSRVLISFTDSTGFYTTLGEEVASFEVGGEYMAAMEAAKRAEVGPARPLTGSAGTGILRILDPFKTKESDQDVIIDAGNYYMQQLGGDGSVASAIRALSTDVSDAFFYEDSVTTQVDNFARMLRAALKPILGPYVLDEVFFDIVSATQQGVRNKLIKEKALKAAKLETIADDPDAPDSFIMTYKIQPFFSGARGTVFIYI